MPLIGYKKKLVASRTTNESVHFKTSSPNFFKSLLNFTKTSSSPNFPRSNRRNSTIAKSLPKSHLRISPRPQAEPLQDAVTKLQQGIIAILSPCLRDIRMATDTEASKKVECHHSYADILNAIGKLTYVPSCCCSVCRIHVCVVLC